MANQRKKGKKKVGFWADEEERKQAGLKAASEALGHASTRTTERHYVSRE